MSFWRFITDGSHASAVTLFDGFNPGFTSFAVPPLDLRKSISRSSWFLNEIETANAIASWPEKHCAVTCLHHLTICFYKHSDCSPSCGCSDKYLQDGLSRNIRRESIHMCAPMHILHSPSPTEPKM
ncbi:hypothetical protein NXS19_003647 [Fusarium pseudograminearum]|nr:hypothetical protein NXS19_003647 [Fusarium pseudograminearum]